MTPPSFALPSGGAPRREEAAAIAAALAALLDDERARAAGAAGDPRPAAYRSRWRRAAALDAVAPMPHAKDTGAVWSGTA